MAIEINDHFYCPRFTTGEGCIGFLHPAKACPDYECYHRKWPPPEQCRDDCGKDYPDEGAVYFLELEFAFIGRNSAELWTVKHYNQDALIIVCACTPFGKPDKRWLPDTLGFAWPA